MKLYRIGMFDKLSLEEFVGMKTAPFASFKAVGTWRDEREPCRACGWHWQGVAPPLLVEWEPSSDIIGDFSWDGPFGYVFVVQDRVVKFLKATAFGCPFLPVEVVRPSSKRKDRIVPFPYQGPNLTWCWCDIFVDLDQQASQVKLESSCLVCGDVRYTFRNKGIVIRRQKWNGEKMFRITTNGRSAATFVSEEGKALLANEGFSNLGFAEAGEILD